MTGFVLNPPRRRRKARRSARRGRRRNARGWFHKKSSGSRVAYSHPSRKSNPRRKRRRSRRRNPGAFYALNPRRKRRRKSRSRRRRNPGATYLLNAGRKRRRRSGARRSRRGGRRRNPGIVAGMGGLMAKVPQVIGFRLPVGGLLGRIGNGIIQSGAAGGVVFGGFVLSSYVVNFADAKLRKATGESVLGKFQRPILLAGMAGAIGTVMRFGAKFVKGSPSLWFLLGAAGPGLAAVASLLDLTMNKEKSATQGGILYRINKVATGLADYIQVGDEALEAGVGDYIQVGDEAYEAGVNDSDGDDIEVSDEVVEDAF